MSDIKGAPYDETNVPGPEYRVRPVTRFVVTRYCHPYQAADGSHGHTGSSESIGEFANEQRAVDVARAMAAADQHPRASVTVIDAAVRGSRAVTESTTQSAAAPTGLPPFAA